MAFNENTRVKIPAILHLSKLGYEYISLSNAHWDESTNIFTDIFSDSLLRINPDLGQAEIKKILEDVTLKLEYEDLGFEFYKMLTSNSGVKLIDFENFDNNSFHVVTELTCKNGDDEFRPDITVLINGMPLAFIEVKKPNNTEGVLAERDRINVRFRNKKFRKFINISQLLVFSNNMEYDSDSVEPVQGAFYSGTSYQNANFNCFREEENFDLSSLLKPEDEELENFVLRDNNLIAIKHSPEFQTNKEPDSPTNRILTSLFSRERLAMLLKYGIAYVKKENGYEKHIMRYPQFFAAKAIEKTLDKGIKIGIIWHTQGSGKTALAFYCVNYLTNYFQKKGIIPKFYFIVDRIDLLTQAKGEFTHRGLTVHTVNSKQDLINDFRTQNAIHNLSGQQEITVVNIQKFEEDPENRKAPNYDLKVQRIYFLDEAHRSYNPKGNFLANLIESDRNSILIALTGTPLIGIVRNSKEIFGDYIHKYYYNASIADGYTLKLIREGIETNYKMQLEQTLKEIEVLKGDADKRVVYSHPKFVEPMLDYIVTDFLNSRKRLGDNTIGGMVVCDTSDQAREMYKIFSNKYNTEQKTTETEISYTLVSEPPVEYGNFQRENKKNLTASLILHDIGDRESRKDDIDDFKNGKIDFLFVYNMLLTGFDAHRLKKLYIGRVIRDHNLLQTLTRVNRPYKKFRYGFVVDFADIRKEFEETNKAYLDELHEELGNEIEYYSNLFKSKEEIEEEIKDIKEKLFHYDLTNAENFSRQISSIEDRKEMLEIKKALENAKNLYNMIRLTGNFELLEKIDFKKLNDLYKEATNHLALLNLKDSLENNIDNTNLLNMALESIIFKFRKISENELVIADRYYDMLRKTRESLGGNFDKAAPDFTTLYDEFKRLFKKKNLSEISQDDMNQSIGELQHIFDKATELNRKNALLKEKYKHDEKYSRMHKRILEIGDISTRETEIQETLSDIKTNADEIVMNKTKILDNEEYFKSKIMQIVLQSFDKTKITLNADKANYINNYLVKEYLNEYQGAYKW